MPPRWLCAVIVASWLLMTGWLFYGELLVRLLPGQAPPVSIDLVEEAQLRRASVSWAANRNDREAFTVRCRVEHPRRDVFELIADYEARAGGARGTAVATNGLLVSRMSSTYRVNAAGDLLGFEATFTASAQFAEQLPPDLGLPLAKEFAAAVRGVVEGDQLLLTRELAGDGGDRVLSSVTLDVGRGGAVLLPLHPYKRMRGLSPGQRWRAVLIDPLSYFLLAAEPPVVGARVRPETEPFRRGPRQQNQECQVIDYDGDRVKVTVWVSEDDGTVIAQEAVLDNVRWMLMRP